MNKSPQRLHPDADSPPSESSMYSEIDCGVCYRTYNTGRRCPRELHCKHTFCESCLLALSRPPRPAEGDPGADRLILCPLCRHTTSISGERRLRAELRVDECALERLVAAGALDQEEDDDPEDSGQTEEEEVEAGLGGSSGQESGSAAGTGGGRLRRSWKRVWRMIIGKDAGRETEIGCLTDEDFTSLAIMSSMF
ncbi:E3 ubiquitin-protein ligase-like [Amphiprion ocellaris]|nr:E3 ubiquitin-protein ligase-like [Amphiprion ocellaris]